MSRTIGKRPLWGCLGAVCTIILSGCAGPTVYIPSDANALPARELAVVRFDYSSYYMRHSDIDGVPIKPKSFWTMATWCYVFVLPGIHTFGWDEERYGERFYNLGEIVGSRPVTGGRIVTTVTRPGMGPDYGSPYLEYVTAQFELVKGHRYSWSNSHTLYDETEGTVEVRKVRKKQ